LFYPAAMRLHTAHNPDQLGFKTILACARPNLRQKKTNKTGRLIISR